MKAKPFPWQEAHVEHLVECLSNYPYALDASDTGTGKTFTSLFAAKALGQKPFIVAPKIVISAWREAARLVGIEIIGVANIEKIKAKNHNALTKLAPSGSTQKPIANWQWNLPKGTLVIWDEVHQAGGLDTQNSRALAALGAAKLPCLMMSATVADDPLRLKSAGYLLGLHDYVHYRSWCTRHGCVRNPFAGGWALMFSKSTFKAGPALIAIHKEIFPDKGARLKIADIDEFPANAIMADAYDLPDRAEVQKVYDELEDKLQDQDEEIPIVARLRAKQNVELLKSSIFVQLAIDAVAEGKSVAIFVAFRNTMEAIETQLLKKQIPSVLIKGGQKAKDRDEIIAKFQSNEVHVIICMVQAGGVGISLHDLNGRPRESLISPPDSAKELKQVLGRIHRAGSKSKSIQKIIYVAGTVEEKTCANVRRKLNNLSTLNDGDLGTGAGF